LFLDLKKSERFRKKERKSKSIFLCIYALSLCIIISPKKINNFLFLKKNRKNPENKTRKEFA